MNITPEQKKIAAIVLIGGAILYIATRPPADNSGVLTDPTGNNASSGGSGVVVFNAKNIANDLYLAMRDTGTEEEDIMFALRNVSQAQFAQVVTAFGRKQYNTSNGTQYALMPWTTLPFLGLKDWLKNELTTDEYKILRLKYPNYL